MGRNIKFKVVTEEVEKLASYGCTVQEVADFFNCSPNLISKSYSDFYARGKNSLKKRLRMAQIKSALDGNVVMQIWLGKQYLEQAEKQQIGGLENSSPIKVQVYLPEKEKIENN